ncbi:MAG TPA: MFS transporter [Puia sp.]|nr:MFS transporter [Puia sp.]
MIKSLNINSSRWYRLIPVVFITYSLAYLDRANFGFGAAAGMARDLHITSTLSSLLGSMFFLGYFFFQIPGTLYAEKKSAKKLIFWSLILWGVFAAATGIISNIKILIIVRFMVGVAESAVLPALLLLLSRWFTKKERSRANTLLMFGNPSCMLWMSIISGYLIHTVGWRWMFIWEGLPAIIWAFIWWKLVEDRPEKATWLKTDELKMLQEELKKEQLIIKPVKNYVVAFKSKMVVLLCFLYVFWSFGMYGFVIWLPSIINAAPGIGIIKTGWLSAIPYLMAVIAMIIASYFSDKTLRRKPFIWPFLLLASLSFYGTYLLGGNHFWLSFSLLCIAGMCMYIPYGPFFAVIIETLPVNVAGGALALINSFGALGSFAGSYLVGYFNGSTGGFGTSYIFMSVSVFLSTILTMVAIKES